MKGFLLIVIACTLWALDTLIRYPLVWGGVNVINIVFYEHLFLALLFSVVVFKSKKAIWNAKTSHYFYFLIVGGLGSAVATLSFTQAFMVMNPSLVIVLQKFQPIVAILLARFVLKEQLKGTFIFWAIICIFGVLLISIEDIQKLINSDSSLYDLLVNNTSLTGYGLVAISVISWGASTVFGKKLSMEGYEDKQIMAGRFTVGLICMIPFVSMNKFPVFSDVSIYAKIFLMILISGVFAMYAYYHGLRRISARACTLAELFFPFMAVIVNWVFLNKSLSVYQLAGGGLLLLGSLIIQLKRY